MVVKKIAKSIGIFFHKLAIWLITFLISTLLVLLILTVFISFNNLMPFIAKGIYDYGDQSVKDNLTQKFDGLCDYFSSQIKLLESQNKSVEDVKQSLLSSSSDEEKKNAEMVFEVAELCSEYQANKITFESLFINSISSVLSSQLSKFSGENENQEQNTQKQNIDLNDNLKNNQKNGLLGVIRFVKISRILLPIIILFLFGLLYLMFIHKPKLYLRQLGKISLKVGIALIIPYLLIQGYILLNPINTTPLLKLMSVGLSGGPLAQGYDDAGVSELSGVSDISVLPQKDIEKIQKEYGIKDIADINNLKEEDRQKLLEKLKETQQKEQQGKYQQDKGQSERELNGEINKENKEAGFNEESEGDTGEFAPDISKGEIVGALAPLVLMHVYNLGLFILGLIFMVIGILLLIFIKKEALH
ncbi:hypothetical protein J4434_01960 [Candidatus Woesearchaeota archaeon]|nr:hypothetical protein [Candidatus Woesearchaeota archaeon]